MPQEPESASEVLADIAHRKCRAGQARFGRTPSAGESPKKVYEESCARIAAPFTAEGYRYLKSGPRLTHKAAGLVYNISFHSSHHNISGEYVGLDLCATISCPILKNWRVANQSGRGPSDSLAGGQIGNLVEPFSWIQWNLADPVNRGREEFNATKRIRELVLPYFSRFRDTQSILGLLQNGEPPAMSLHNMFDFAACFSSLGAARAVACRFLARRPAIWDRYKARLRHYQQVALPDQVAPGWADELAIISLRYGLGNLFDLRHE